MILLVGSGYVGSEYRRYFEERGIEFRAPPRTELDATNRSALRKALSLLRPSFVLNAAGYTGKPNVDAAEREKLHCMEANIMVPCSIAQVCAEFGIPWGAVSSGCIYTGARPDGGGFREEDEPNFSFRQDNCSFYSGTKALAEEILASDGLVGTGYLWRLRMPFNQVDGPRNYLTKLMRYARLVDVRNSISFLDEFIRATFQCWEKRVPFGIYNVTNPGSVTTREVVAAIQRHGLVPADRQFTYFADETEFLATAAKAPRANCVMDPGKLLACGIALTEVHDAVDWCLRHWRPATA